MKKLIAFFSSKRNLLGLLTIGVSGIAIYKLWKYLKNQQRKFEPCAPINQENKLQIDSLGEFYVIFFNNYYLI